MTDPIAASRRQFLAASGLAAAAGAAPAERAVPAPTPIPIPAARATSGDRVGPDWKERLTLTVGPKKADLVGSSHAVLQAAVNMVARLGGGTVRILPGTYRLRNAVRPQSKAKAQFPMSTHTMRISLIFSRALVFSSSCLWEACLAAQTPDRTGHTPYHAPWDESKKLTRALDRTVDFPGIDDRKTELGQVLDGLEKKYGLTFTVNERAFDEVKLDDVRKIKIAEFGAIPSMKTTLGTVLKKILNRVPDNSHATYLIRSDSIEITTQATWFRELGLPPHTDSYRLVKEQFRKMELRKALEVLGADVLIDIRVEKQARTKVNARLYYVPVEAAVELLADMAGLEVVPREGTFYVTSPDNAARMKTALDARARRPSDEKDLFFRAGLRSLISIRSGNTLQRAMEATGEEGGVNLLIDPRVEKKLRVRLPNRLAFFPTPTVLELLADMAGLAVVKRSNVYYVTSPDNADRLQKGNAKRTDKDATSDGRANGKQPRRLRP